MRKQSAKNQVLNRKSLSARGFSLPDLMIGAVLTLTVVSAGGYGVATMISTTTTSNAKNERRVEMNRSLDFIANEIRGSDSIIKDVSLETVPSEFTSSYSGKIDATVAISKVLMIKVPQATTGQPIIYFAAKPTSGLWQGPRVIYRWGPQFDANGEYITPEDPSTWTSEPLVDRIENSSGAASCVTGTANGDNAFYSCVDSAGKTAKIYQKGRINKVLGQSANFDVSMNVGSRRTTVTNSVFSPSAGTLMAALPGASPTASPSPSPSPSPTPPVLPITLTNGEVKFPSTLNMSVKFLGGDITCGAGGAVIPTSGKIYLTGARSSTTNLNMTGATTTFSNVPANTYMTITGTRNSSSCISSYSANSKTDINKQVLVLKNGDSIPSYVPLGTQRTIDAFLTNYLDPASSNPKKVKIASNQLIYLYEVGTTSASSSAYDMQDLVVLATFTNP
jgi:hypothetical protein